MKEFRFGGYSDDTFGEVTPGGDDYDNCASGDPVEYCVYSSEGSLVVVGQHCPGSATGWMVGIARVDDCEEEPIPAWPMRFEHGESPYSPVLVIEAPEDAITYCITRKNEEQA